MNVICIPLTVFFGETEYQENVNLSKQQFYELLTTGKDFPKTAQPSPQFLLDIIEQAKQKGDDVIYISLSSGLSGTYQSAVITAEMAEYEKCHVIDGRNATGGQRLLVEAAVKMREMGKTAAQIAEEIKKMRERVTLYACIDTLEYLHRGGRISHVAYTLGNLAQIKPIISVDSEGKVALPGKTMGMRKGITWLCKKLDQQIPDTEYPVYVMYTDNRTNGEALAKRVREMGYEVPDSRIINVGAAIGSHIGPDACGLVYISKN